MPHLTLPDGARLAYEMLGSEHFSRNSLPIVFVGGASNVGRDFEPLAISLARVRPVLLYDIRGIGHSTMTGEEYTVDLLARDLLALLKHVGWKKLAICGFSMGGTIAQSLIFLPFHATAPESLPFVVTHVVFASSLCSVITDQNYGLRVRPVRRPKENTRPERNVSKAAFRSAFDPRWMEDPRNEARLNYWIQTSTIGRFDLGNHYHKLSRDTRFLVIHGSLDAILPPSCSEEILQRIPWARKVEVGAYPGAVPTLEFGHNCFDYFDIQIWHDVIEMFLVVLPKL
ncbi:unnamed protein product [Mycena citricolor]|uniref:AB hydrolase-1 domain-containing protein n=1 Tax=Mycena citricolor TaxID=2018698 RepID=A0AAD2HJ34_9AGAR|nr:unnamed protein product [Mycena citricolor]CAK5277514.1 unnamed protein product [Mycena citricolor]